MYRYCAIILILLLAISAQADTFHMSVNGSDGNNGKSWAAAMLTIGALNDSMAAGDTALFGSGEWPNSQITPPTGGAYNTRTIYACSTLGSDSWQLTTISAGDSVPSWSLVTGSVYKAHWVGSGCWQPANADSGHCYTLIDNDTLLEPQTSYANVNSAGEFYHAWPEDTLYAWFRNDANPSGHEILASCKPAVLLDESTMKNVLFYGLRLEMGKLGVALFTQGADSIFFERCRFNHSGYMYMENSALLMSRAHSGCDTEACWGHYNQCYACSFYSAIAESTGVESHAGSGIILYGQSHFTVDSCWFCNMPGTGVMFKNSYATTPDIAQMNLVKYSTFENLEGYGVEPYCNCYYDSIYGCTFRHIGDAGVYMFGSAGAGGNKTSWGHVAVLNNTFFKCNNFISWNQFLDSAGTVIKYNVCYDEEPTSGKDHHFVLEAWESNVSDKISSDSNSFYDSGTAFSALINSTGRNWSQYQGLGFDVNGRNVACGIDTSTLILPDTTTLLGGFLGDYWGAHQPVGESSAKWLRVYK